MAIITRRFHAGGQQAVLAAYARLSRFYDLAFGPMLAPARSAAIAAVNMHPGTSVLEVGVGTGLALPCYAAEKRVTGIDLSVDMLAKARARVDELRLKNVEAILELDAQATGFADGQFDIAVAMFVASVVPNPRALLREMRRVVKPGGVLLFVNHFARHGPAWWRTLSGNFSKRLGWRADFLLEDMFDEADIAAAARKPLWPWGLFQLVELQQPRERSFRKA